MKWGRKYKQGKVMVKCFFYCGDQAWVDHEGALSIVGRKLLEGIYAEVSTRRRHCKGK